MIYLSFISERWDLESALIRWGTKSWASHVRFVRTNDKEIPFDTLGSRLDGGVLVRPYLTDGNPTREEWYTAPHIEDAYAYGRTLTGQRYDWKDILGIAANEDWHTDGRDICSEFIARCGEYERVRRYTDQAEKFVVTETPWLPVRTPTWRITPRDLLAFAPLTLVRSWGVV
jgi:hypothetical protein